MKDYTHIINDAVAKSFVGRRFRLDGSGHVCALHDFGRGLLLTDR